MSETRAFIQSISVQVVVKRTGCCRSSIYDMLNRRSSRFDASFPRPFKIGRRSLFVASEIDDWISQQMKEARV